MVFRLTQWLLMSALLLPLQGSSMGQDLSVALEPETVATDQLVLEPEYPRITKVVARRLPNNHLSHAVLGDDIAEKALRNFLDALDFDHSVFLVGDVEAFRGKVKEMDDRLIEGRTEMAFDMFRRYKERAADRVAYVDRLLEGGFDFLRDENYTWKRKAAPWPEDQAAWDELWRKKVKNEYIALSINQTLKRERADEASAEEEEEQAGTGTDAANTETAEAPVFTPEELIRKRYTQFLSVLQGHDAEFILQLYLTAFAQAYDAHSAYLSPRGNEDFDIEMKLSLSGIGAVLTLDDGAAKVVRLVPGGPADRDGRLSPGDRIIAVAQKGEEPVDIMYWPLYKSVRLIRGEVGTEVTLEVIPASDVSGSRVNGIVLVRDEIKLEERAAHAQVHEIEAEQEERIFKLGVIRLPDFYADLSGRRDGDEAAISCSRDVKGLLGDLVGQQVDGLVLDLRNNGGGSLMDAIEMTGFFLESGPVVQVKPSNQPVQVIQDPDPGILYEGPMVVLVNRQSASASEILVGALQDYGRAVIVGDSKTHGKGSVQSVRALSPWTPRYGSLRITTAGFYRIDGRSTQLKGVTPDIVIPSPLDVMEVGEEFLPNVLPWSRVAPAPYRPAGQLEAIIPELRRKSEARRAQDERYQAYNELLMRLQEKLATREFPLNLEQRLAQARQDQELEKLQARVIDQARGNVPDEEEDTGEEKDDPAKDLLLSESLLILRDLIEQRDLVALTAE